MKTLLKWAGYVVAGIVGLAVTLVLGVFLASEAKIRWPVERPVSTLKASTDTGAVARGKRVAVLNGCQNCHGQALEGNLFHDDPKLMRAYAPNLSLLLAKGSDAAFDGAIRHGVGLDGRRLWIMPAGAYKHLSDQEVGDLMAYLRTLKPTGERQPRMGFGPIARVGVLIGKLHSEPDAVRDAGDLKLADLGPQHATGRDLARGCIECHGQNLDGRGPMPTANLDIVASYDPADFERLLRTGVAAGNRKVGLMSEVAPVRFNILSSAEIASLQGYLTARANRRIAAAETPLANP